MSSAVSSALPTVAGTVTDVVGVSTSLLGLITANPILMIFFAGAIITVGVVLLRKLKRA